MLMQSWNPNTVVDTEGKPLVGGRVTVYEHDSNVPASIYTIEEDGTYTAAMNPQLLNDDGRLDATIFMAVAIYDIRIEKPNGDGTFSAFDWFEYGIDVTLKDVDAAEVATVSELMDLDPSVSKKYVTVDDGIRRTYMWDAASTDTPDGGIVVDSNVSGAGNWILLWDCPYLPCGIYGVSPADTSNLPSLLTYSTLVGSAGLATPSVVRFTYGDYDPQVNTVSTKALAFDQGARFVSGKITVPADIIRFGNSGWVGDFSFSSTGCTARSADFRTANAFLSSGADTFRFDAGCTFDDSLLDGEYTLTGKHLEGNGRLPVTYTAGSCIALSGCQVCGRLFSRTLDFVRLSTAYGDGIFGTAGTFDPGRIADGHHVQYDIGPDLDMFESADNFVKVAVERKTRMGALYAVTVLDLEGRTLNNGVALNATNGFTGIRNATIKGLVSAFGQYCNLYNVICTLNVYSTLGCTVSIENSYVSFEQDPVGLVQVASANSHVEIAGANGFNTSTTALNILGGTFQGYLSVSDTYTKSKNVTFNKVILQGSTAWKLNRLFMEDCIGDVRIDLYPWFDSSKYYYEIDFQRNTVTGSGRIWFTGVFTALEPKNDMAGNVQFGVCRIRNNTFIGAAGGVKMLREHPYTFTHFMASTVGPWEYSGNSGDCPVAKPGRISNATTFSQDKKSDPGLPIQWLISDNTFNAWAPYDDYLSQNLPVQAQAGDNVQDSIAELVDSVGGSAYPKNIVWGWSNGLPSPPDLFDEDQNNQFTEYLCLTWDLPVITVPNGITRFPG